MLILNFSPFPVLITERLLLRAATLQDAEKLSIIRSDARVNLHLERNATMSIKEAEERIHKLAACTQQNESIEWIIQFKDNVEMLGSICLWNIIPALKQVEIGYEMHPTYYGKGIMQEAMQAVIEYAFKTIQAKIIIGTPMKDNEKSIQLLKRNHFVEDNNKVIYHADDLDDNYVVYVLKN